MGKNKLKKFAELETIEFVYQYPHRRLEAEGAFPHAGAWRRDVFRRDGRIVLELGCGKGEYTVGLARQFPDDNFIGIDIKGARIWTGACRARDEKLDNVAFLRTEIENLAEFFAPGEVDEIWITFPDPQMKKATKRLTGTRFLELYRRVLRPGGLIRLKTDSPFLYTYTGIMARHNSLPIVSDTADLYADRPGPEMPLLGIRTYYEQQWLARGLSIKYISFSIPDGVKLEEPEVDIPYDTYRSFSRGTVPTEQNSITE